MTMIGKFFVMLVVTISLLMMATGIGLYSSRMDWSETPAKMGKTEKGSSYVEVPAGLLVERKEALKAALETVEPARRGLASNSAALEAARGRRAKAQAFYSTELAMVRTEATEAMPARFVQIDPATGRPRETPEGLLVMQPARDREGDPLGSIAWYQNKLVGITGLRQQYVDELAKFNEVSEKDIAEAQKLGGTPAMKGLLEKTKAELIKEEGLRDEITAIAPSLELQSGATLAVSPKKVEAKILEARLQRLDQQIAALEKEIERLKKLDGGASDR